MQLKLVFQMFYWCIVYVYCGNYLGYWKFRTVKSEFRSIILYNMQYYTVFRVTWPWPAFAWMIVSGFFLRARNFAKSFFNGRNQFKQVVAGLNRLKPWLCLTSSRIWRTMTHRWWLIAGTSLTLIQPGCHKILTSVHFFKISQKKKLFKWVV